MVQWIRWLENEGGYRWFDPGSPKTIVLFFSFYSCILQNLGFIVLTGTLDIATDIEPQPIVIFVSNIYGTDNDETVNVRTLLQ